VPPRCVHSRPLSAAGRGGAGLGSGRMVVSEIEAPNMLGNLV
jgi:hypothetical protein